MKTNLTRWCAAAVIVSCALAILLTAANSNVAMAGPQTPFERIKRLLGIPDETDVNAPIDYGQGPGIRLSGGGTQSILAAKAPVGTASSITTGEFGAPVTWPIIPIHVVLLPDGRVMNYGSTSTGQQGAELVYDVWDPKLGTGKNAHLVLPNGIGTDIFCSGQTVLLSGDVLASGGDLTVNTKRNSAQNNTTIFSPSANTLIPNTPMTYSRWYGSLVAMPNGQLMVFGGRENVGALNPTQAAITPELYDPPSATWSALTGATSADAFGPANQAEHWWYPRAFVAPGGNVFVLGHNGQMFFVTNAGQGTIQNANVPPAPVGSYALPTISFAPGMALSLRMNQEVDVINYTGPTPIVTPTASMDQVRYWSNGTIMADGRILITGGSQVMNELNGVAYQAQIWNPATGLWTAGATATKPRLYHSTAMLLPNATVLTAGGGAPGPVKNLNAEIYYPPYLYNPDGTPAVRPIISSVASSVLSPGETLSLTVGPGDTISTLNFIRTGSATHSFNGDQSFLNLSFQQTGQNVTAVLPTDTTSMIPGYYMVFAFNTAGGPSVAAIVQVLPS